MAKRIENRVASLGAWRKFLGMIRILWKKGASPKPAMNADAP
jgi:hypothetical protein